MDRDGSRRSISSATSWITAVLPLSKLAHTRVFSGRGGGGSSPDAGREVGKKAFDDLLRGPYPRRTGKDGSHRSLAFFISLLPFGQPGFGLCGARLDHGNALGIHGGHQDCAGGGS